MREVYNVKYESRFSLFKDPFIEKNNKSVESDIFDISINEFIKSNYDIVMNNLIALSPNGEKIQIYALSSGNKALYGTFDKNGVELTDIGKASFKNLDDFLKNMPEIYFVIYLIYFLIHSENTKDVRSIKGKFSTRYKLKGSNIKIIKHHRTDDTDYVILKDSEKNSVSFIVNNYNKHAFTVPNSLYPLANKNEVKVFSKYNTFELENDDISEALLNIDFLPGKCYANSDKIVKALEKSNLDYKVDFYSGWIYNLGNMTHHSWIVINDKHLLDTSFLKGDTIQRDYIEKTANGEIYDVNRDMISSNMAKLLKSNKSFKDKYYYGKVNHDFLYIGVKTDRDETRESVSKLLKKYPNHPSYEGTDSNGENKTLKMIYEKL